MLLPLMLRMLLGMQQLVRVIALMAPTRLPTVTLLLPTVTLLLPTVTWMGSHARRPLALCLLFSEGGAGLLGLLGVLPLVSLPLPLPLLSLPLSLPRQPAPVPLPLALVLVRVLALVPGLAWPTGACPLALVSASASVVGKAAKALYSAPLARHATPYLVD